MSTEEISQDPLDTQMQLQHDSPPPAPPTGPAGGAGVGRKRPRLDLALEPRERKRGKTMFGLVLGTLKKAKTEDKERNASDAARKRQEIEQRLQEKLRKETDSVRRAEDAKKDKTVANRKEEELQLKDSIYKLRRTHLPLLANFLSTADKVPSPDAIDQNGEEQEGISSPTTPKMRLKLHIKSHPPPIYYLPKILTKEQEVFLTRRKEEVARATELEWNSFKTERQAGIEEIQSLRQKVVDESGSSSRPLVVDDVRMDVVSPTRPSEKGDMHEPPALSPSTSTTQKTDLDQRDMEVDDEAAKTKSRKAAGGGDIADEDDAIEY